MLSLFDNFIYNVGSTGAATEEDAIETEQQQSSTSNIFTGPGTVGDYSHFNNKLSIADFDLLKVLFLFLFYK